MSIISVLLASVSCSGPDLAGSYSEGDALCREAKTHGSGAEIGTPERVIRHDMALGSITLTSAEIPVEPSKTTFGSYLRITVEFTADDDLPGAWSISPTSFIGCGPDGIVYTPLLGSAPASIGGDRLVTTQVTAEDPVVTGTVLFAVPPAGPRDVVFAAGPDGPLLIWSLAGAG